MKELYTICPNRGDVIVHTFEAGTKIDEVAKVHSDLIRTFPDNQVLTVPDVSSVCSLDRQSTVEMLREMIEMLESNSKT